MTKSFFTVRGEAYSDMTARKQKLLNRSNDAYKQGDLGTMRKAHSLAMKQDSRTRAKYPDESIRSTMSGATKDYADREKKLGPGKVRDSVEYPEDTNVIDEGMLDFMSSTPTKPKSKLTLSAMREISRREDLKKNMNKVVRSQDEPQNANYRTVRVEEKEKTEYDYEGDMARGQLQSIISNAQRVHDMLEDNTNIAEWVQSKITLAEDYISTVANYMMSEIDEAKKMEGEDPCWDDYKMIGTKKKNGKEVPNCVPESVQESDSARLRMAKALQKAKDDRERSERNADKLLNPDGKEVGEPKKEKMTENSSAQQAAIAIAKQKSGKYNKEGKRIKEDTITEEKPGLYANIHAKRRRIKNGSGERMRKPGSKGAPTAQAFKDAQKTVKENIDNNVDEGIASLVSRSIKRVTAVKPTPQQKADIRLNK